jgi:hypothetical protein
MNNTLTKPSSSSSHSNVSPFARALAEAKAGDQSNSYVQNPNRLSDMSPDQMAEQQRLQEEKMRRERLRQTLHRQINPVETTDVYNAEKQRVKKQIEEIRHELKLMVAEVAAFHEEIEISIMANVPDAGTQGKYYFSFFEKLKELIKMMRQQIHSARTWATAMHGKKKKRQGGKAGLEIGGQQYEQTATIYDRAHHERSTQYSGS